MRFPTLGSLWVLAQGLKNLEIWGADFYNMAVLLKDEFGARLLVESPKLPADRDLVLHNSGWQFDEDHGGYTFSFEKETWVG